MRAGLPRQFESLRERPADSVVRRGIGKQRRDVLQRSIACVGGNGAPGEDSDLFGATVSKCNIRNQKFLDNEFAQRERGDRFAARIDVERTQSGGDIANKIDKRWREAPVRIF